MEKANLVEFWNLTDLVPVSFTLQSCDPPGESHHPTRPQLPEPQKRDTRLLSILGDNACERSGHGGFIKL